MITAQEAHDLADKARDLKDKVDLTEWRMTATKTVEDIVRAESSQGKWSVEIVVEQKYAFKIMKKLNDCGFFSYKNDLMRIHGIECATIYVSWILTHGKNSSYAI